MHIDIPPKTAAKLAAIARSNNSKSVTRMCVALLELYTLWFANTNDKVAEDIYEMFAEFADSEQRDYGNTPKRVPHRIII